MPRQLLLPACLLALALWPAHGTADEILIYRCTDTFGQVTLQNGTPCAKGQQQQVRRVQPAQTIPVFRPLPAPPRPAASNDTATTKATPAGNTADAGTATADANTKDAEPLPPPPLYQCNTPDGDSYLGEEAEPPARCVTLQTVGIGGLGNLAAGAACQMVQDECQRIGDDAACDAWARRAREAQAAWRFAPAEQARARQDDYERIHRVLAESLCAQ